MGRLPSIWGNRMSQLKPKFLHLSLRFPPSQAIFLLQAKQRVFGSTDRLHSSSGSLHMLFPPTDTSFPHFYPTCARHLVIPSRQSAWLPSLPTQVGTVGTQPQDHVLVYDLPILLCRFPRLAVRGGHGTIIGQWCLSGEMWPPRCVISVGQLVCRVVLPQPPVELGDYEMASPPERMERRHSENLAPS